ncbi:hypothetical protein ABVT39_005547 [Epinephelus coioides]
MNVMLSLCLWFALMLSSCCGDAGSHEEETTTADYDYQTATATEDYDYTATFDYYYVTGIYPKHVHNKLLVLQNVLEKLQNRKSSNLNRRQSRLPTVRQTSQCYCSILQTVEL